MLALLLMLCFRLSAAHDWLIEPGVRVGPIRANSTEADIRRAFGPAAVVNRPVHVGEGQYEPATLVYPSDPSRRLSVLWREGRPEMIFVCHELRQGNCGWRTTDGIGFGTSLEELERRNGKPFEFSTLYWRLTMWNGGKLERLSGRLILGVLPRSSRPVELSGDRAVWSNDRAVRRLVPRVMEMIFEFPHEP